MPSNIDTKKWCFSIMSCSHAAKTSYSDVALVASLIASDIGVLFFQIFGIFELHCYWLRQDEAQHLVRLER